MFPAYLLSLSALQKSAYNSISYFLFNHDEFAIAGGGVERWNRN